MAEQDETRDPPEPRTGTPSFLPGPDDAVTRSESNEGTSSNSTNFPVIPGYDIVEMIGEGGMGVVYRAREMAFDRDVAIKLLHSRYGVDSPGARRFLDEARITGQLQHPAIPPVHHISAAADGRPLLVMKLVKGNTLANLLVAEPDSRGRHVAAFARVCQALAYAHSRKVIHRDLKPANVMVGAFGEVLVMDWGLAKVLAVEARPSSEAKEAASEATEIRAQREPDEATHAGSVLGTPAYMAPEQAQGAVDETDERSDVFGLGAMLCAILTGKPPYVGPSTDSIRLKAIRGDTADALARLDGCGTDPELTALCKWCLVVDRGSRPRDAGEVSSALSEHLAAVEERAREAELERVRLEGERARAEVEDRERRKRQRVQLLLVSAVLGLLMVAGFGFAAVSLWRDSEIARDRLSEENKETEAARDEAISLKGVAERAQANEAEARQAVEREREKLEAFEYGRRIEVAHQEWRDDNIVGALALLNGTKPQLRGWEWHYVHRLCNSSLLTLRGHMGWVSSASFSPDGARIVTGSWDKTAKVWDARTGTELLTLKGHSDVVSSASFSPDGSRIVTRSTDETAKVWDARTGAELLTLKGTSSASFTADGSRIVGTSEDNSAKVWDAKTGAELLTLKDSVCLFASFTADGSRIVTSGGDDNSVRVLDAKTATELLALKGHTSWVISASFSADDSRIVTGSRDNTAKVWNARTGAELLTLKGHTNNVSDATFSVDGSRIVTGSDDNTAKVWDAKTGTELLTLKGHVGGVSSASFSADGSRIVTGSTDMTAKVWDARKNTEIINLKDHLGQVYTSSFSADGSRIVTGSLDGTAKVWNATTGTLLLTLKWHTGRVSFASFSADGSRIITGGDDKTAKVWDAKTGADVMTLSGHSAEILSASFSADGSQIVTGSGDTTAKVWDAKTGSELVTLKGHAGFVSSTSFSMDGSRIVTASWDTMAKVWDTRTGAELLTLKDGHTQGVTFASFSPDGSRILTAAGVEQDQIIGQYQIGDHMAKVWDARTGTELMALKGHAGGVNSASFSPDGSRIVTASGDKTAKIWDARTGAELLSLKGHTAGVFSASFSPDGSRIVTGSWDGTARIWDATPLDCEFMPRVQAPPPRAIKR